MPHAPLTELPDLIDWLTNTIEPLQGEQWQITLNGNGGIVEVVAKVTESQQTNERGHTMTISKVVNAKFRLGSSARRKTVFSSE